MHPQKKLTCELCGFKTNRKGHLIDHVNGVHLKVSPYKCLECEFTTAYHTVFSLHTKKRHVKCEECPFITSNYTLLKRHGNKIHNGVTRSDILPEIKPRDSEGSMNAKNVSVLKIEDSTIDISPGTKSMTPSARISCDICGFVTGCRKNLVEHVNGVHLKIKPYKCDQCEYTSAYDSAMFHHKKKPHFDCAHCKFVTHSSKHLKEHTKTHGEFSKEEKTPNDPVESKENAINEIDIKPIGVCDLKSKKNFDQFHRKNEAEKIAPLKVDDESNAEQTPEIPHLQNSAEESDRASQIEASIEQVKSEKVNYRHTDDTIDAFWTYEEIAFACNNFTSDSGRSLTNHISEVHNKSSLMGSLNQDENGKAEMFIKGAKKTLLKCHDCTFVSSSAKELVNHCRSVHLREPALPKPKRKCSKCTFTCETFRMLWKHKQMAHVKPCNNAEKVKCPECNFFCSRKRNLYTHFIHSHPELEPIYKVKCLECNYECSSRLGLQRHVTVAHTKNRRKYEKSMKVKCSECPLVCKGKRILSRHALDVHQKVLKINKNPRVAQKHRNTNLVKDKLCHFCPYSTAYESGLKKHLNAQHIKDNPYKCHLCDFSSYYPNILKQHKEAVHCHINSLKCSLCMYTFQNNEVLNRHLKLVHGSVKIDLKCPYCEFKANEVTSLDLHIREAHIDSAKRHKCNHCLFSTYSEATLHAHRETAHRRKYIKLSKCYLCTSTLYGKHTMKTHLKKVHGNIQVDLKCQNCTFEAMEPEEMEVHYRESHIENAKLITCGQCQFSSYHEPTLSGHHVSVHEKNISENAEDVCCRLCNFVGASAQYLKQHMTMKHGMKNHPERDLYRCYLCLSTFTQRGNIKRHTVKIHGNIEVDLKCCDCNYECNEVELIELHYKQSHPGTVKLNACDQCHFSSYHHPTLKAHKKSTHEGKKCELCSFVGMTKYDLKRHIDIRHVKIRNHACDICGFATFLKAYLESHIRTHIN